METKMKSITYIATVDRDRKAIIDLPADIAPGTYTLRVYVEEQQPQILENPFQELPTVSAWEQLQDVSLRREDIYGDEGR
jgi:hypothetical protein